MIWKMTGIANERFIPGASPRDHRMEGVTGAVRGYCDGEVALSSQYMEGVTWAVREYCDSERAISTQYIKQRLRGVGTKLDGVIDVMRIEPERDVRISEPKQDEYRAGGSKGCQSLLKQRIQGCQCLSTEPKRDVRMPEPLKSEDSRMPVPEYRAHAGCKDARAFEIRGLKDTSALEDVIAF
jgi:hypothetical protein